MKLKKIIELMYHPKLVNLSYKIYEISAGIGFAVMPKEDKKLNLYKIRMMSILGEEKILDYVMYSKEEARQRWEKEYKDSTWRLNKTTRIDEIDGYSISFPE